PPGGSLNQKKNQQFPQPLPTAAQLMNQKKYDVAAIELNQALDNGPETPAVGFAMGEILRATQRYSEAVAVFAEVLKQDPDFPEAPTKLSFNLYRTAQTEEALPD